ncbi:Branched-chain-amino-acid aminotransferase [compost metagenome]
MYFGERTNPNAKIVNDSFRDLVNKEIKENNAYEAILVDRNGDITEGSRSNIFMVKNNTIITSPLEAVLPGVTRGEIIELCLENNIDFKEEKVNYKDLDRLDGLFITGTSPKILPITSVNDRIFNSNVNEIIKVLIKTYDDKINTYVNANKSNL